MDREIKTITTPSGASIKIKTYITGRESEQIDNILYKAMNLSAQTGNAQGTNLNLSDGAFLTEQTHKTIELMVVSVDDKTDKILDTILDMKQKDYLFVISEIEKVTKDIQDVDIKKK